MQILGFFHKLVAGGQWTAKLRAVVIGQRNVRIGTVIGEVEERPGPYKNNNVFILQIHVNNSRPAIIDHIPFIKAAITIITIDIGQQFAILVFYSPPCAIAESHVTV
ncbi:hypothetical protein SAMN05660330_01499 [Desulforhopalus singaporensis]|uniref:Uncharacterized protein n=1 Tax=Desulforhopalus singaporensis TaxID=91360 RepID=A0A1H0NYF0_9BACT|nr:hypothetical protein SAMN05660330_01499 [Desulforhopalus singaporensis]